MLPSEVKKSKEQLAHDLEYENGERDLKLYGQKLKKRKMDLEMRRLDDEEKLYQRQRALSLPSSSTSYSTSSSSSSMRPGSRASPTQLHPTHLR